MHQVVLPEWAVARGLARRSPSAFNPARTAFLVVDLQNGFMLPGQKLANEHAIDIVPNVNAIAKAIRAAGGTVVFLRHTVSEEPRFALTASQLAMVPRDSDGECSFWPGRSAHELFQGLDVRPGDEVVNKHRYSAFLPNSSDLHSWLNEKGIDSLIIAGTVTNCCCESTARDANMMGYHVYFISDATAAQTDEEHNASLLSMATIFADVQSTDSIVELISASSEKRQDFAVA